jgi:hypothetical protein
MSSCGARTFRMILWIPLGAERDSTPAAKKKSDVAL